MRNEEEFVDITLAAQGDERTEDDTVAASIPLPPPSFLNQYFEPLLTSNTVKGTRVEIKTGRYKGEVIVTGVTSIVFLKGKHEHKRGVVIGWLNNNQTCRVQIKPSWTVDKEEMAKKQAIKYAARVVTGANLYPPALLRAFTEDISIEDVFDNLTLYDGNDGNDDNNGDAKEKKAATAAAAAAAAALHKQRQQEEAAAAAAALAAATPTPPISAETKSKSGAIEDVEKSIEEVFDDLMKESMLENNKAMEKAVRLSLDKNVTKSYPAIIESVCESFIVDSALLTKGDRSKIKDIIDLCRRDASKKSAPKKKPPPLLNNVDNGEDDSDSLLISSGDNDDDDAASTSLNMNDNLPIHEFEVLINTETIGLRIIQANDGRYYVQKVLNDDLQKLVQQWDELLKIGNTFLQDHSGNDVLSNSVITNTERPLKLLFHSGNGHNPSLAIEADNADADDGDSGRRYDVDKLISKLVEKCQVQKNGGSFFDWHGLGIQAGLCFNAAPSNVSFLNGPLLIKDDEDDDNTTIADTDAAVAGKTDDVRATRSKEKQPASKPAPKPAPKPVPRPQRTQTRSITRKKQHDDGSESIHDRQQGKLAQRKRLVDTSTATDNNTLDSNSLAESEGTESDSDMERILMAANHDDDEERREDSSSFPLFPLNIDDNALIEQGLRVILARSGFDIFKETPRTIRSYLCEQFQIDPSTLTKERKKKIKSITTSLIKRTGDEDDGTNAPAADTAAAAAAAAAAVTVPIEKKSAKNKKKPGIKKGTKLVRELSATQWKEMIAFYHAYHTDSSYEEFLESPVSNKWFTGIPTHSVKNGFSKKYRVYQKEDCKAKRKAKRKANNCEANKCRCQGCPKRKRRNTEEE